MRKCTEKHVKTPEKLNNLLNIRRLPLSEEGEEKNLHELGLLLSAYQGYLAAVHVDADLQDHAEITPEDVREADLLLGEDEKYLPVFTSTDAMAEAPFDLSENTVLYYMDVMDLHTLLSHTHADAAVLNPGTDDLILSRNLLQNMLQMDPRHQ